MVDKIENFIPTDEPRVTFDYSGVNENLFGTYLELSFKFTTICRTPDTVIYLPLILDMHIQPSIFIQMTVIILRSQFPGLVKYSQRDYLKGLNQQVSFSRNVFIKKLGLFLHQNRNHFCCTVPILPNFNFFLHG